jgi:lysozyme
MRTSAQGKQFIKGYESLSLGVYLCPAGVPTIGWGHTGPEVRLGMRPITMLTAEAHLESDLVTPELAVRNFVKVPLTQGQFDALASLIFNVGPGRADQPGRPGRDGIITLRNGRPSTLLRKLNAGDYTGAAEQILVWNRSGGVVLGGLVRRRKAEYAMFTANVYR